MSDGKYGEANENNNNYGRDDGQSNYGKSNEGSETETTKVEDK